MSQYQQNQQQGYNTQQNYNSNQNQYQQQSYNGNQGNLQVCYDPQNQQQFYQQQTYSNQQQNTYQNYNTNTQQNSYQSYNNYNSNQNQYQSYNNQQQYYGNQYQGQVSYVKPQLSTTVSCTYSETGKKHVDQFWYFCMDCSPKETLGCCVSCAIQCHNGHRLSTVKYGSFFCDCGLGDLKQKCSCLVFKK